MFDEVIVAVDDDEAVDAPSLGRTLASPVAALMLAHVEVCW